MRRLRVLLDSNVIVDAQVRDLFCRLAEADLIDLYRSGAIIAEGRRVLTESLRLDHSKVDRLIAALARAFPDAAVVGYEPLVDELELPDADDRHVCGRSAQGVRLARHGQRQRLSGRQVDPFDLLVVTVDDALVLLAGAFRRQLAAVVDRQVASLRRPAMTRHAFLERLAARAPIGAAAIGKALDMERDPAPAPG